MNIFKFIILALALFGSVNANAGYFDGSKLATYYSAYERVDQGRGSSGDMTQASVLMGYVQGVADSAVASNLVCLPSNATVRQIVMVVGNHLRAHPNEWAIDAAAISTFALTIAFPCSK